MEPFFCCFQETYLTTKDRIKIYGIKKHPKENATKENRYKYYNIRKNRLQTKVTQKK